MKPNRLLAGAVLFAACSSELPHEAPFDPNAPLEKQAKASLSGSVRLEGETDFSQVTLDLQNADRTYNVDTAADGAVSLTGIVPGVYTLKIRTRYFQPVTESLTVEMGATVELGTRVLPPLRSRVLGLATSEQIKGNELVTKGGVALTLRKTASVRTAVAKGPAFRSAAAVDRDLLFSTLSGSDGDFEFPDVPAGGYELSAASDDAEERVVGAVTVTGEGDVTVDPIVLRPLTGYFEILGSANGVPSSTYTSIAVVNLQLQQSNAVQVKVAVSTNGTTTGCNLSTATAEALPSNTLRPLTFTSEGKKLVCVSYVDADGKETAPIYGTITYDATPPTLASVAINGGAQVVSSNLVTLSLGAVDVLSGVAVHKVHAVNAFGAILPKPFQPTDVFTLGGEGLNAVWVTFGDQAGNYSAPVSATVLLDTIAPAPVGPVTLAKLDGTPLTSGDTIADSKVRLTTSVNEATPVLEMQITTNGSYAGQSWVPYDPAKTIDLPSGASTISVRVRDGAGHIVDLVTAFDLTTDTTPPTGTLVIAPTAVTDPAITVQATGSVDAVAVELAFDPGFVTSLGNYVPGPIAVTLPAGDGTKTVYGRFFDAAGNSSGLVGDTVVLDTTPPQVLSFTLAQASPTKDNPVTVNYSASGAAELRITEGLDCGGVIESIVAGTKTFTVSSSEGVKDIRLQFFDAAGNASECAIRTIYFDPNPPVIGALQINYGQAATSSNVVTLSFPGVSGASKVMVSEDAGFSGADWQSFAATKTFTLSPGNGVKTVYAKVSDDAGHVVALTQQTITLDTTPPTSPSIFAAYDVTTQTSVLVTLSAGLVSDMWLTQDDPAFTTGGWETYSGSKVFALSGADGVKTIYAKFKKSTGLETGVVSDTVILDRAGPTLPSVQINGGAAVVASNIVTLSLSAVDGASGLATYKVNTVNDFSAVSPKPFQPTDVFSFASGDGPKTVWVTIGDRAGLYSTPVSATVLLDNTPPAVGGAVTLTKLDGTPLTTGATVSDTRVLLNSSVTDLSTLEMQVTTNGSYSGVAWVPYEPGKVIDLTSGSPSISVRVRDGAGLVTEILTAFTLTVDTTAPALTFSRTSAATTNDPVVSLTLSANESGQAQVSEDPAFGGAVWFATGNTTVTLPAGDGLRTIYARARDAAGNFSVTKQVSVQLDTAAPGGASVAVNAGAGFTKTAGVSLAVGGAGAVEMQISENAAFAGAAWQAFSTTYAHTITGGEGTVNIYVRLRDEAGNVGGVASAAIVFDSQAPTGASIAIAEQPKTRQSYVTLALAAVGATELVLADNASFAGRPWQPVTTTSSWTLPPGDGTKTVYVKYRDAAGNESAVAGASIILDTTPPVASSLMLNGGATITSSTTVGYAIAATDALSEPLEMQVSGEPGFGGAAWVPYAPAGTQAIAPGDGVRSLYVRFRDAVGNVSLASSGSFILDQAGPQIASFVVNEGRGFATASVYVDFQVGNWAAGDMVQVATAADFSGAVEYPSNAGVNRVSYTLAAPDGAKTVYARAKDPLGNVGPAWSTTVTLDTVPPAVTGPKAMVLAGDADFTTTRFVNLDLNVSGATEMLLWNSGQLLYATWEPFSASVVWALPFGDGVHTVQARFRDAARNVIQGYSDMITLDTGAPTSPSIAINGGAGYITATTVALTLSAVGATGMQLSGDGVFDTEPLTAYNTSDSWTFTAAEGQKTVYARFCDDAGNCSQVVSASVVLDTTLPTGAIAVNQGAARTNASTVTLNLTAGDAVSGLQGIKLANSLAALATTDVVTYEATKIWTLAAPTGAGVEATKEVWLQVVDRAGLGSTPVKDEIVFDSLPPTGGLTLSAAVTSDTLIGVDLSYDADVTHYKLSAGNSCAGGNWVEASTETVFTLPGIDGAHDVSVRFRDGVLNESTCYSANVVLDRAGPTPQSFTVTGNAGASVGYSDTPNVTVDAATVAGDCDYAELAEDVGFIVPTVTGLACSLAAEPYMLINSADGFHTLYLRYFDTLGNPGPVTGATLVLDTADPQVTVAGGFTIAQGAYTNDPAITLQLAAAGATKVAFGEGAGCAFTPEAYLSTKGLTLSGVDGAKTVSVRYVDDAGNASVCYAQTVTLDTFINGAWGVALVGSDGRSGTTTALMVTAAVTGIDLSDVAEFRISNIALMADAFWSPITTAIDWPLLAGDGAKTVFVELADRAGNKTLKSASIVVDQTAPDAPAIYLDDLDGDGFALSDTDVEMRWTLAADAARSELEVFVAGAAGGYRPVTSVAAPGATYVFAVTEPGGMHRFRVRVQDAVGNQSQWSGVADAYPIQPRRSAPWFIHSGRMYADFSPLSGVGDTTSKYVWQDITGYVTEQELGSATSWDDAVTGAALARYAGRLETIARNQDGSLRFNSSFDLETNHIEDVVLGISPVMLQDQQSRPVVAAVDASYNQQIRLMTRTTQGWVPFTSFQPGSGISGDTAIIGFPGAFTAPGGTIDAIVTTQIYSLGQDRIEHWRRGPSGWSLVAILRAWVPPPDIQVAAAADETGTIHVAAIHNGTQINYFNNSAGYWTQTTPAVAAPDAFRRLALAHNQAGRLALFVGTDNNIFNWVFDGTSWSSRNTVSASNQTQLSAVVFKGKWGVVWAGAPGAVFTSGSGASWTSQVIQASPPNGDLCAAADTHGRVFAWYVDAGNVARYAVRTQAGTWKLRSMPLWQDNVGCRIGAEASGRVDVATREAFYRFMEPLDVSTLASFSPIKLLYNPVARRHELFALAAGKYSKAAFADGGWPLVSTGPTATFAQGAGMIDANGRMHVLHDAAMPMQKTYLTEFAGTWTSEPFPPAESVMFPSMGVNPTGKLVVAYTRMVTDAVVAVRTAPGNWVVETIEPSMMALPTLLFPNGVTAIVYSANDQPRLAIRAGAAWSFEDIGPPGPGGSVSGISAALLGDGRILAVVWVNGDETRPSRVWVHVRGRDGGWTSSAEFSSPGYLYVSMNVQLTTLTDGTAAGLLHGSEGTFVARFVENRFSLVRIQQGVNDAVYGDGLLGVLSFGGGAKWTPIHLGTLDARRVEHLY